MSQPTPSPQQLIAGLTAAGAPFELVDVRVGEQTLRAYRNAFPTLPAMLQTARAHGTRPFIVSDGQTWSFDQLFTQADALAAHWQGVLGLRPGDRVAIAMRNRPEWAVALVAAMRCGAVPAPLNSLGQRDELLDALQDLQPRLLVCDDERWARVQGAPAVVGVAVLVLGSDEWQRQVAEPVSRWQDVAVAPDDTALILYTSGASSRAKGVLSSHRAVCQALFNIDFIGAFSAATSPDALARLMARGLMPTTLTAVPLFHVSGLHAQLLLALRHGRRLVFMRRWQPAQAIELIREHRVTQFNGAPSMVAQLLAEPGFDEAAQTLGGVGFGGAGLPQRTIDEVLARLPGSMSGIGFGMTESNGVGAAVSGRLFEAAPHAAGMVSPLMDVQIADPAGQPLPAGEVGEVWLRGVTVMQGYWRRPEDSAQVLAGGWLHTGDLGRLEGDGRLVIVDRIKDVINRHGEKIAAAEVESCLLQHRDVTEAAVFGVSDADTGEAVVAVLAMQPGAEADAEALRRFLAERLTAYKLPAHWWLQTEPLPRNPAGKLLKGELRQRWLGLPGGVSR